MSLSGRILLEELPITGPPHQPVARENDTVVHLPRTTGLAFIIRSHIPGASALLCTSASAVKKKQLFRGLRREWGGMCEVLK
jgi:hypothetical protein